MQGDIKQIAWEVAKQDRITNRIDLSLSTAFSEVYHQQERVKETLNRLIDISGSREVQRKELLTESIIVFGIEVNELVTQEVSLLSAFQQVLNLLEGQ